MESSAELVGSPTIALRYASFLPRTTTLRMIWAAGCSVRTSFIGWMASRLPCRHWPSGEADIPRLAEYFVNHYNKVFGRRTPQFSELGIKKLMNCQWHGNMRELENVIRRYVIFGQEDALLADLIRRDDLIYTPEILLDGDIPLKQITRRAVRELEYKIISRVLLAHHGNRTSAAHALKISYRSLMYKIRDSGIPRIRALTGKPTAAESPTEAKRRYQRWARV